MERPGALARPERAVQHSVLNRLGDECQERRHYRISVHFRASSDISSGHC